MQKTAWFCCSFSSGNRYPRIRFLPWTAKHIPWKHFYLPAYGTWRAGIPNSCILKNLESGMHTKKRDGGSAILFLYFHLQTSMLFHTKRWSLISQTRILTAARGKEPHPASPALQNPMAAPQLQQYRNCCSPVKNFRRSVTDFRTETGISGQVITISGQISRLELQSPAAQGFHGHAGS